MTLSIRIITTKLYCSSRCHGDLFYNRTVLLSFTVVFVNVYLPYWTSKVEHVVAFTAIFSNICTAHAQKRLFMNFRCKRRNRRSIRLPRFLIRVQNFSDLATLSVDFCILYAKCPPYFYFRFVWPTDLQGIPHASTPTSINPTTSEINMTIDIGQIEMEMGLSL